MWRWLRLGVAAMAMAALLGACGGGEEEGGTPTASPAATAAGTASPAATLTPTATPAAITTPLATATPSPSPAAAGLGKLAFVREGDIWVLDVDSGQERQLTTGAEAQAPRWSPDGQWVAFYKSYEVPTGDLWVVRADGSGAAQVQESAAGGAAWAPNGNRLAYPDGTGVLTVTDVESGQRQQVSPPGSRADRFAWFPDGKRLVLELLERAEQATPGPSWLRDQGLWLVNADGTGLTELRSVFDPAAGGTETDLGTLSPDGHWLTLWEAIVSASLRADGLPLRIMPAAGGEPQEIASATLLRPGFVVWSPNGDRLAVVEGGGREVWANKQIVVMRPDGSDRRVVSEAGRVDTAPAWSPDGRRLAFASMGAVPPGVPYAQAEASLFNRRIWTADLDTGEKRQLTDDPTYGDDAALWSADGQYILFPRRRQDGLNDIWLMRADGSQQRPLLKDLGLPQPGGLGYYDWSALFDWYR